MNRHYTFDLEKLDRIHSIVQELASDPAPHVLVTELDDETLHRWSTSAIPARRKMAKRELHRRAAERYQREIEAERKIRAEKAARDARVQAAMERYGFRFEAD